MKKFFKVLALALALALVVGIVPAQTASAAGVKKSKTLFVEKPKGTSEDGSITSKIKTKVAIYKLAGYTKETKEGHTFKAEFVGEDKGIIKIGTSHIKALKLGTATVQIYVDDVKASRTTTIKVNENATAEDLVLVDGDKKAIENGAEFVIGGTYTFMLPRAGKDSDERRLFINGEIQKDIEGKDRQYSYTFSESAWKAGDTVTLKFEAFQGGKLDKALQSKEITGKVIAGTMDVQQSAYNAIELTFSTEGVAKAAAEATAKSLSEGTANVTENRTVVKIFEVGANNEVVATFLSGASIDGEVITLTTFNDLKEKGKYRVEYLDFDPVEFTACEWTPNRIVNSYVYTPNVDEKGGTAKLATKIMALGEKGQDVDITQKVIANGYIEYLDGSSTNDYTKYTVSGDLVDFYDDNVTAPVKSQFTYYKGTETIVKDNSFNVTAKDTRKYAVIGYKLVAVDAGTDAKYTTTAVPNICVDDGFKDLDVCIGVDVDGDGKYQDDFNGDGKVDNNDFIFIKKGVNAGHVKLVTSNNDKLAVDELNGKTYSPKESEGKIGVYVYYKDVIVDGDVSTSGIQPIYVNVYAKRVFDHITVTAGNTKYSYSTNTAANINLHTGKTYAVQSGPAEFTVTAYDQFGDKYSLANITVEKTTAILDGTVEATVDGNAFAGISKGWKQTVSGKDSFKTSLVGTTDGAAIKTVSFRITAEDTIGKKVDTKTFSFTVKNCDTSTITSTVVEAVSGVNYTYRVVGKDSAGYTAIGYYVVDIAGITNLNATDLAARLKNDKANDVPEIYVGMYKNNTGKLVAYSISGTKDTFTLKEDEVAKYGGLTRQNTNAVNVVQSTVSGAAVTADSDILKDILGGDNYDKYVEATSYSARAYKANNTSTTYLVANSSTFKYDAPKTFDIAWNWKNAYTEYDGIDAIDDAVEFALSEWADDDHDGTYEWTTRGDKKSFSDLGGLGYDIYLSYSTKDNSISLLYIYIKNADGIYLEKPILRTLYTNYNKE